jgi:hypothetical protein
MVRIHPAIGIARIGNSEEEFFIGPEIPGVYDYPVGGYRDDDLYLKRQGARFRLFGYDEHDRLLGEIQENDARITWSVHLVNTKAAGRRFAGVMEPDEGWRNTGWITKHGSSRDLILDPGEQSVFQEHKVERFLCQTFMSVSFKPVLELGRLIYEEETGRLIVLGGHGRAGTPFPDEFNIEKQERTGEGDFANHDGWFDDISDGPVTAKVELRGGPALFVMPAWVIIAPPKYAPELQSPVSLYDTLYQVAIDRGLTPNPFSDPAFVPSFNRDIYPVLRRADELRWVFSRSNVGHHFVIDSADAAQRQHLFRQLRVPSGHPREPSTGTGRMPYMWSDLYHHPAVSASLTRTQYSMLSAWASGAFRDDWTGKPPAHTFEITPPGLDRAALEACVGAAFYPGIECSWKMRDAFQYVEPFRLNHASLSPGDVSQQMSLPWQTDFVDCAYEDPYVWWPAQRPIDVRTNEQGDYSLWASSFDSLNRQNSGDMDAEEMVRNFYRLGHILPSGEKFLESGRVATEKKAFKQSNFATHKK